MHRVVHMVLHRLYMSYAGGWGGVRVRVRVRV